MMSKLDSIKATGYNGLYKAEIRVEDEWVALALLSKRSVIVLADAMDRLSDQDNEAGESQ
jgi:hypothetical protein